MIKTISHYTYETSDGTEFSNEVAATKHEKALGLPAVYIVTDGSKLFKALVFSTAELAEDYLKKYCPHSFDLYVERCVIDYNLYIREGRK